MNSLDSDDMSLMDDAVDRNETSTTSSTTTSSSTTRLASILHSSNNDNSRRIVRPNLGNINILNDGQTIYLAKTDLHLDNISMTKSNTPGVMARRPFNPNSQLISLCDLMNKGSKYGTNLMLIILSISAVSTNNMTMYQQKSNGVKGGTNTVRHDRNMVVMCPLSPSGNNTAMILFGAGCCERFFDGDISLRDNGEIRE